MKITARMICVTDEYKASEALVLPVEAQAAFWRLQNGRG